MIHSGEERIRNTGYDTGSILTGYDTGYSFLVDPYPRQCLSSPGRALRSPSANTAWRARLCLSALPSRLIALTAPIAEAATSYQFAPLTVRSKGRTGYCQPHIQGRLYCVSLRPHHCARIYILVIPIPVPCLCFWSSSPIFIQAVFTGQLNIIIKYN